MNQGGAHYPSTGHRAYRKPTPLRTETFFFYCTYSLFSVSFFYFPPTSATQLWGLAKSHLLGLTLLTGPPVPGTGITTACSPGALLSSQPSLRAQERSINLRKNHRMLRAPCGSGCCLSKPALFSASIFIFLNH